MKKLKNQESTKTPEQALETSLRLLVEFTNGYKPVRCRLTIDGVHHEGEYLMIEVMNSRSIGPNLFLAPNAKPDDGLLEVVLISANERQKLSDYVNAKLNGSEKEHAGFQTIKGKKIEICWAGNHVHVDDEDYSIKENFEMKIELHKGLLEFLAP